MHRSEALRTPIGQAAWSFYKDWMRMQKRRVANDMSFVKSRFYTTFIRFAEFVWKTEMPKPDLFIRLMVERKFPPTMWLLDDVYIEYIKHLDQTADPKEVVGITVDTLFSKAEELQCDIGMVFDCINPSEVIELVKERKLSPWFLLNSRRFGEFLFKLNSKDKNQYIILEQLIPTKSWTSRFKRDPQLCREIKRYVDEMDL
jgi:hypothetical protein